MKNALLKSQYRLEELRDEAQAVADKLFSFVLPESILNGESAIVDAGEVAAKAIIERNAERVIKIAVDLVKERQPVNMSRVEIETLTGGLSDVFVREMAFSGQVCLGDIRQWADKANVMGSSKEANVMTINKAYNTGSPPLFSDHDKRVKQAIAAWHNALFQGVLMLVQSV